MSKRTRGILLLVVLGSATAAPPSYAASPPDVRPSLCMPSEVAVFSCDIGTKIASLCASFDISAAAGTMVYRYGRRGAVEISYPEQPLHPRFAFTAGVDNTPGDYVRFVRNGTTYTVFSSFIRSSRPHTEAGVLVSKGPKVFARLICRGHDDGLGPDGWKLMYRAKLPQDRLQSIKPASN